jgi:hypothetical protein
LILEQRACHVLSAFFGFITMANASDLLVLKSVGALVAEEWSVNPLSMLPSFLEMKMIEDASKSSHSALRSIVDLLIQQVSRYGETTRGRASNLDEGSVWSVDTIRTGSATMARKFSLVLRRFIPELRCIAIYLFERYCLRLFSSTLAESLYGTKRMVLVEENSSESRSSRKLVPLKGKHATRLALALAIVPYLREKLNALVLSNDRSSCTQRQIRLRQAFLRIYNILAKAVDSGNLLCQWRFLLGRSVSFDLTSFILGQIVRRVTQQDEIGTNIARSNVNVPASNATNIQVNSYAQKSILYLLCASFAFGWLTQIRSTWQEYRHLAALRRSQAVGSTRTSESAKGSIPGFRALPPPPHELVSDLLGVSLDQDNRLCPLCRQSRVKPAASTSGHVFCHDCLVAFVKQHGVCPVTGVDCTESRIIRLYEPHHNERGY